MKPLYRYYQDFLFKTGGFVWFVILSVIAALFTFLQAKGIVDASTPMRLTCLQLFANIGYGYITGYIFYIATDFFANVHARIDAMQNIIVCEKIIFMQAVSLAEAPWTGVTSAIELLDDKMRRNVLFAAFCAKDEQGNTKKIRVRDDDFYYLKGPYMRIIDIFAMKSKPILNDLCAYLSRDLNYQELEAINQIGQFMQHADYKPEGADYLATIPVIEHSYNQLVYNTKLLGQKLTERLPYCADEDEAVKIKKIIEDYKTDYLRM